MSHPSELAFEYLQPGDAIEFADITEVPAFEDIVATTIEQEVATTFPEVSTRLNLYAWGGRVGIGELVRSQKPRPFNGTIANVRLEVMADPYARLLDARERGWSTGTRGREQLTSEFSKVLSGLYRGFIFVADAKSSGKGTIGQIQAELWYVPTPIRRQPNGSIHQRTAPYGGSIVHRFATKPKLEDEKFIELHENSRRVGFEVLRRNMRHPIIQPMHE